MTKDEPVCVMLDRIEELEAELVAIKIAASRPLMWAVDGTPHGALRAVKALADLAEKRAKP